MLCVGTGQDAAGAYPLGSRHELDGDAARVLLDKGYVVLAAEEHAPLVAETLRVEAADRPVYDIVLTESAA